MTATIVIIGKASTISAQLAALQPLGLVPAGRQIEPKWDSRAVPAQDADGFALDRDIEWRR